MPTLPICLITEEITPWDFYSHSVEEILLHKRTEFQEIFIVRSRTLGKALILDGRWQSSEADEFLYHEALVHPASILHSEPHAVLIFGGGEGATLREVLRWKCVSRALMVDIDGEVVNACRNWLPEFSCGAFADQRTQLQIGDAAAFISSSEEVWDLILLDLTEPLPNSPASHLYSSGFYAELSGKLRPSGCLALQVGPLGPSETEYTRFKQVLTSLSSSFPHVLPYGCCIPTYPAPWGFCIASYSPLEPRLFTLETGRPTE